MKNCFLGIIVFFFALIIQVSAQDEIDCSITLEIWQIQGSQEQAACLRERVLLESNLVTATGSSGFFMQTPADRADGDEQTSDGIYVFTDIPAIGFGVQVGDLVTVEGRIGEFYNLTQIEVRGRRNVEILSSGNPVPDPIDLKTVDLSWNVGEDSHPLERFEGMLVAIYDGAVVAPTNYFDEFGVSLSGERVFREEGIEIDNTPELSGMGLPQFDLNPELIEIDPPEMGLDVEFVTVGSRVDVVGGLAYAYADYQIWPRDLMIEMEEYSGRSVRARDEGEFSIATQNMYNLFDLVDDPRRDDSPFEDYVPANSDLYQLRLRKMSEQIREILGSPDILAIQELENARVLTDLALQVYEDDPTMRYATCFQEGNDSRGIDNAFLVNIERVNLLSCYRLPGSLDASAPVGGGLLFGRPPLILEVELLTDRGRSFPVTLVNLHIKSLSGADTETVQAKRMTQAVGVAAYIQQQINLNPDAHIIVLGDLNAFEFSDGLVDVVGIISGTHDPERALMAPESDTLEPDLVNQVMRVPQEDRYSYIYNSTAQVLDHILTTAALDVFVVDAQFSRGNADALYEWDYEDNGALRSSDHDGFVVFIQPDVEE